jgi:sec-independent protein translocase protein TatC
LSHQLGFVDSICITELPFIIQNTSMEGQVNNFVWICVLSGFILSVPYILLQVWNFIAPALYDKEKKNARIFIFSSSLLFFMGVLFGYFVVIPMSVNFLATFTVSDVVKNQFTLDSYMGMVKTSVLASGLFFELPIIIYFLTKLGLVTPKFLRKYWKYAVVIILIVAAIVTPPDVVSQTIVAIPMLIIYELSILISIIVYRNKIKTNQSRRPMSDVVKEFNDYRAKMNEKLLADNNKIVKRIFNLDTNAYAPGALDVKTKELLGLVASTVLRCDDCIKYHLETSYKEGISKEEMMEAMGIATLVGGTIVIPHLRRAYEFWEALENN